MSVNTVTTSNKLQAPESSDGYLVGAAAASLIGFYGATPMAQPTAAAQAHITDASGGSASATTGIQALTAGYNSAILANAIATLAAGQNAIRDALVSLGVVKGS